MEDYIVGVDIGSSKVCAAAGKPDKYGKVKIIGVTSAECHGMKNGIIIDIDSAAEAIKNCITRLESIVDTNIKSFYISLPGRIGTLMSSQGMVAISSDDNEITKKDVNRVKRATQIINIPNDKEIVDIIPKEYIVDGYNNIKDPIGMSGNRMELDAYLVLSETTIVNNLLKTVEKAGYNILGVVFAPIADAKVALKKEEMKQGTALVNVGADSMDISVYKDDILIKTYNISIGGNSITNDISICLKIPFSEAEKLKIKYGIIGKNNFDLEGPIKVNIGYNNDITINPETLRRIVEARVEELLILIQKKLKESDEFKEISNVVIVGGGLSLIKGIEEFGKYIFNRNFRIGSSEYVGAANPIYVSSVGVVKSLINPIKSQSNNLKNKETAITNEDTSQYKRENQGKGVILKIKEFLTEFF
ncbi:cell division protein FtsA [Clostridium botulinum]|nr:cell division protein FtsA [Clostridium botulinum]